MKNIPNIEALKVQTSTIILTAKMKLAEIPVTIRGQYNIDSNCYYPSQVTIRTTLLEMFSYGDEVELEDLCDALEWDYYDTYSSIQRAIEERDKNPS